MYLPPAFQLDDLDSLHAVMRGCPLATLVTRSGDKIVADHIPFLLDAASGDKGVLRGHVARANPLWQAHPGGMEALVIFTGPDHYVTPSWYATKRETGKVVPTWNYVAIHAYGPLRVCDDPAWLRRQLDELTALHEAGRASPWAVSDAPADFIAQQMQAIVGIEIAITRLEGKRKISQNRSRADREGVVAGLAAGHGDKAQAMSRLVAQAMQADVPDPTPPR
ncbi:MAG: FMN-binding negative transcriptional regulator [Burkholderiaceae bacterium]|jgi:transcriptional regulator|nr:FMN-binding negative transcriptional regulator [Burkholderiaceae bacterium]